MAQMARAALEERKVTVDRLKLIETLKENRSKHVQKFQEAVEGYVSTARELLQKSFDEAIADATKRFDDIKSKLTRFDPERPEKMPSTWSVMGGVVLSVPVPANHSEMYRTAIEMMEWDTRKEVELTYAEFQCFVQDEWEWKSEFEAITARYSNTNNR